jgi:hypothetical protein
MNPVHTAAGRSLTVVIIASSTRSDIVPLTDPYHRLAVANRGYGVVMPDRLFHDRRDAVPETYPTAV